MPNKIQNIVALDYHTTLTQMSITHYSLIIISCMISLLLVTPIVSVATTSSSSSSEYVKILKDEIITYTDSNGVYTIAGNVKNTHASHAAIPILELQVQDGITIHKITVPYNAIPPKGELPFKIKMPDVSAAHATLKGYELFAITAPNTATGIRYNEVTLDVIYDHTLVIHDDGDDKGHLSGFAINSGNKTLYNPVIWAVVHGKDNVVLDVVYSKALGTIKPGQIIPFELYPDDSVSDAIVYYSCFAPSDRSVHPLTAQRGDQKYGMRYESGAWLYRPVFSENGTVVTIRTTNSYPFETFANVEIPAITRTETFEVLQNGKLINNTQSMDETGSWHIAFEIRERSQDIITIRGFEHGKILPIQIPEYVKQDMRLWASGQASDDSMFEIMLWLADRSKIPYGMPGKPVIPAWVGMLVLWWDAEQIDEQTVMTAMKHMIESGTIRMG